MWNGENFGPVVNGGVASYKINLSQQAGWSNIKNLQETWIVFKDPAYNNSSFSNGIYQTADLIGFRIYINGKTYATYLRGQYRNYINNYYYRKTGHYPFWEQRLSNNGNDILFLNEIMSPLRIDWSGILENTGDVKHQAMYISGIDNYSQTYEIELFANTTAFAGIRSGYQLEVMNLSKTLV